MKLIATRFGDYVDLAAAEFAIFGVEIIGEDAKFGDGIEVRNDGCSEIDVLFDVTSVDHEAIREFALAIDRNCAGVQRAGGRERAGTHVLHSVGSERGGGDHAWLQRKQVRVTAAVQWNSSHFSAGDHFAHLGAGSVDVDLSGVNGDDLAALAKLENRVDD